MAASKILHVKYFARFREQLNTAEESLQVTDEVQQIHDLIALLKARQGIWEKVFNENQKLLCAVNQQVVKLDHPLNHHDEVAFYPPVSGG